MKQIDIILLIDYRNQFYEAVRSRGASFDLSRMEQFFSDNGYRLTVIPFRKIDFEKQNFKGRPILYQSSEDRGLLYKDYIEDVLLGLMLQGADLIPDFFKFRAHHNKVFMEMLRSISGNPAVKGVTSHGYGTFEEFAGDIAAQPEKLVLKPAGGSMSTGVRLAVSPREKLRGARKLSSSFHMTDYLKRTINTIIKKGYRRKSLHRRKFIAQGFLPGLHGDFKVLVYGEKYYVLKRANRKNDFRASGSGKFTFPSSPQEGLLDFSREVFTGFDVPFISMDIAWNESRYVLIEFQFLSFGNYTLERSRFHFARSDDKGWVKIEEEPDLEREFVASVVRYLEKNRKPL